MKSLKKIKGLTGKFNDFLISLVFRVRELSTGRYRMLTMMVFLLFGCWAQAQDLMTLRNGNEIDCKITEVSSTHIKYNLAKEGESFIRVVSVAEVFMIKYESGRKEVFTQQDRETVQSPAQDDDFAAGQKDFAGPRVGFTYISAGTLQDRLVAKGKSPLITQFGWQFEKRLFGFKDGPTGMFEFIPLVGGMEQGLFLPSLTTLIGIRGAGEQSVEFAVGPTLSITGLSMVFAVGMNFNYRKVNFPVNIAFVPSIRNAYQTVDNNSGQVITSSHETGHRISVFVGFNVRKR